MLVVRTVRRPAVSTSAMAGDLGMDGAAVPALEDEFAAASRDAAHCTAGFPSAMPRTYIGRLIRSATWMVFSFDGRGISSRITR